MVLVHYGMDLFNYDQRSSSTQVLIPDDGTPSNIEYDEYVVYKRLRGGEQEHELDSVSSMSGGDVEHIAHHFTRDITNGTALFDLAFRHGYFLDRNVRSPIPTRVPYPTRTPADQLQGHFRQPAEAESPSARMEGRIRRV